MPKSDLPFGSEFSPSQIELPRVLELARDHCGDWHKFEAAVREEYFEDHDTTDYNKGKLANNTKLGMIAYGIIKREDACLTDFGRELFDLRHDETALYGTLGRHILLNLHGLSLVQCVQDMQVSGERITLTSLRQWLDDRGIHFPRGGKHASIMRLWLEKAGVFTSGWRVDIDRFEVVAGIAPKDIEALARFTPQQRAYLRALANIGTLGPHVASDVEKLATTTYGVKFNEKSLPKDVLYPLQDAGYVTLERATKGRGAKSFGVRPTPDFKADIVVPIIEQLEQQLYPELRPFLRQTFDDIIQELDSSDKHVRGLALEALAIKLMRLVDLKYIATRLRGTSTGGAEVDVIFEGSRLVFSRWQVQCKNTARVSLDDVAKEVGLTHFLHSNVIVVVTTGKIGPEARRYANKVMQESNLAIVMVDGQDLDAVKEHPTSIVNVLNREARQTMQLKALQIWE